MSFVIFLKRVSLIFLSRPLPSPLLLQPTPAPSQAMDFDGFKSMFNEFQEIFKTFQGISRETVYRSVERKSVKEKALKMTLSPKDDRVAKELTSFLLIDGQ